MDNTSTPLSPQSEALKFIQYHQPPLKSGVYKIVVEQKLEMKAKGSVTPALTKTFTKEQLFSVRGNRFHLSPTDIHSFYPPAGSFSDHHLVVPHIILNRSTLPWERLPDATAASVSASSWLALLLFDEDETPKEEVLSLAHLEELYYDRGSWTNILGGIDPENEKPEEDKVSIIHVKKEVLETILPRYEDLAFLSHIRLNSKDGQVIGGEKATVMANRLPKENSATTVHLVSLEGRYPNGSRSLPQKDLVPLVSLHSWTFKCSEARQGFSETLEDLSVGTFRLPPTVTSTGEEFLEKGFIPLRHEMRMGQKTISWYHGPLSPALLHWPAPALPAASADELLHYHSDYGLFDVAYAAAWELGRKLALEDPRFAMALFHWKKELRIKELKKERLTNCEHLLQVDASDLFDAAYALQQAEEILLHQRLSPDHKHASCDIPPIIETFFYQLKRLEGVPTSYLIPHDTMLPPESIRFFSLDPRWMDCLLDGAYSLGEDTIAITKHTNNEEVHHHEGQETTGFLLRSSVLRGWADMLIHGYNTRLVDDSGEPLDENATKTYTPLPLLSAAHLSEEVLMVFFQGKVNTVDFSLPPDTLHFGLDEDGDLDEDLPGDSNNEYTGKFWQVLRNDDGREQQEEEDMKIKAIPFHSHEERVINIKGLTDAIRDKLVENNQLHLSAGESFCSAHFAMQMMEGASKVRITSQKTN